MRLLGNILWFIFGGWYTSLIWLFGAFVFAITIIGLPLSRSALELAKLSAFPFGKEVVHVNQLKGVKGPLTNNTMSLIGLILNIIWALTFGITLFFMHLLAGFISCCTIVLIPFGIQSFKLALLSLWPVGRRVVSKEEAHRAFIKFGTKS
jgi:uncharacterized membrane protein YccF (DUF307 family)